MSGWQIVLIVLGILAVFVLLALWFRYMMAKLAVIWAANTKFIDGTFSRVRARVTGTYRDRPVMAYLGNEGGADDYGPKTYSYTVRMTEPPGFADWSLVNAVARKGEPAAWTLKAKPETAERLTGAGVLAAVEGAPRSWRLRYRAGSGRLELSIAGVAMSYCPDPKTFESQLDLLARLADLNRTASAAAVGKPA